MPSVCDKQNIAKRKVLASFENKTIQCKSLVISKRVTKSVLEIGLENENAQKSEDQKQCVNHSFSFGLLHGNLNNL